MSIAIEVAGLRKTYGAVAAIDGLDLEVRAGEIFSILGPNGAGKSTTVEILEGYRKRTTGSVAVLGEDPERAGRSWRERVGIMLQSTSSVTLLTAREAVTHASRLYPNPRDVDEVLSAVGLEDSAHKQARTLSGGQRRRLDVALAVIGGPELVFLDEPTTGFDPEARRQFWSLIQLLNTNGTTVVLTTHYLDEAEHLSGRIAVIARGRLVALDTPRGLRERAQATHVSWRDGDRMESVTTTTPSETLRGLLAGHSGEIPGLEVRHPSLEDVYLDLIGQDTLAREEESA